MLLTGALRIIGSIAVASATVEEQQWVTPKNLIELADDSSRPTLSVRTEPYTISRQAEIFGGRIVAPPQLDIQRKAASTLPPSTVTT